MNFRIRKKNRDQIILKGGRKGKTFLIQKDTKPTRNFMRIRILDPYPLKWESITKKDKLYYITTDYDPTGHKFITLDIGDLDTPKVQGIAFIRGIPKNIKNEIGEKVNWDDFRTQTILVEYAVIGVSYSDDKDKQIEAVLKRYDKTIIDFIGRELSKDITLIEIIAKDKDFQLLYFPFDMECSL